MGMIIRVLYNNQDWQAPCKNPGKDGGCWLCFENNVNINPPSLEDEICKGHCWEQHLCTEYRWGCTPQGRMFGYRAYLGMKAFFVFKQSDGNYTLWGRTTVNSVDNKLIEEGRDDEAGFAFIHFNPFEPLTREKWVMNLSDIQLVGEKWLMGRYRYINSEREAHMEQLIEGLISEKRARNSIATQPISNTNLNINIAPKIYERLEYAANEEGRQIEEIVREAIAEWLKGRRE